MSKVAIRDSEIIIAMLKFRKFYPFLQNRQTTQANVSFKTLSDILDDCITRIRNGETIETCLAEYSDIQEHIKPLLDMALHISTTPKVMLSDDFKRISKARLTTRILKEKKDFAQNNIIRGV